MAWQKVHQVCLRTKAAVKLSDIRASPETPQIHYTFGFELIFGHCALDIRNLLLSGFSVYMTAHGAMTSASWPWSPQHGSLATINRGSEDWSSFFSFLCFETFIFYTSQFSVLGKTSLWFSGLSFAYRGNQHRNGLQVLSVCYAVAEGLLWLWSRAHWACSAPEGAQNCSPFFMFALGIWQPSSCRLFLSSFIFWLTRIVSF